MTPVIISRYSPQVLCYLKSMHIHGIHSGFICIRKQGEPNPVSRHIKDIFYISHKDMFSPVGIDQITSFLGTYTHCGLFTISEKTSLWLWENAEKLGKNCTLLLPEKETLLQVLSKKNQIAAARNAGLSLLPTYFLTKEPRSFDSIPQNTFPLCLRPSGPKAVVPSFKVDMVSNKNELRAFIEKTRAIHKFIIAQPFLNLPNLVVHGARKKDGSTIGLQGFLVERKFEGLTLTITPFDLPTDLINKCKKFTGLMNIQGPYHFEFLFDSENNKAWFLELNNRLGGTTAKVFSLGYDEPGWLLKSFGNDIHISRKLVNRSASSKMALCKYLYYTLSGRTTFLDYPFDEPTCKKIVKTLKSMVVCKDDILSLGEIKGAFSFYMLSLWEKWRTKS